LAYQKAKRLIEDCRRLVGDFFADRDALLTPAAPDVAPVFSRTEIGDSAFSKGWTSLGLPCIALPAPISAGLPIGLQLIGGPERDSWLMHVAQQVETSFLISTPFLRRPQ
jgi:Asp-tRNA(Asn)/Glu-tRNA(Gln) amidotransferase A subunit family amidase